MKTYIKGISILVLVSVLFLGCKQDDIRIDLENSDDNKDIALGLPFAKISFKLADFLDDINDDIVYVGEDGLISLRYSEEVLIKWKELVELRDTQADWGFTLVKSSSLKSTNGIEFTERIQLNHRPDVRYDSLFLDQGNLNLQIDAPAGTPGRIIVTIPELLNDNNQPLVFTFNVTPDNQSFTVVNYSLANHAIHFGQDADENPGEEFSYISVVTSFEAESPDPDLVNIQMNMGLSSMQSGLTYGYFGVQETEELNASLVFEVFDELDFVDEVSEIEFMDFTLDVEVENPIGVPFLVRTNNIRFYKNKKAEPDQFDWILDIFSGEDLTMNLDPAIYGTPIIPQMNKLSPSVNGENSDIVDIGNRYPVKVLADLYATSNPEDDGKQNFMGVIDQLTANLILEIPMWFRTGNYSRKDTIGFDFLDIIGDDQDDVRRIKYVNLYFDFTSRMPLDVHVEAWVVDVEGNKITTIIEPSSLIPAAITNEDYKVLEPVFETFKVGVNRDQIDLFIDEKAMEIVLETTLKTPKNQNDELLYIKLFDESGLETVFNFDLEGQIP